MRRITQSLLFATVPLYLNYQSLLLDGGGNPLPSGPVEIRFRITDAAQQPLYEERQTAESHKGVVSALVGNGVDPATEAPTAGLTPELFQPGEPRFLEVIADGVAADEPLEIVSVPYALWSERIIEGGVTGSAIAPAALHLEHFGSSLIDDLAAAVLASAPFATFQEGMAAPGGAGQVGVNTTFLYSGATTVQGVLKDFDLAIKAREEKNVNKAGDAMSGNLALKNGATVTGVPSPSSADDAVPKAFVDAAVTTLTTSLANESNARTAADAAIQTTITSLTTSLANESNARTAADAAIQTTITSLTTNLANESNARTAADAAIQTTITSLVGGNGVLDGGDLQNGSIGTEKLNFDVATQGELAAVEQIANEAKQAVDAPPPAPKIVAWARVDCGNAKPGDPCAVLGQYNVQIVRRLNAMTTDYEVMFEKDLGTAEYAVTATPISIVTQGFLPYAVPASTAGDHIRVHTNAGVSSVAVIVNQ